MPTKLWTVQGWALAAALAIGFREKDLWAFDNPGDPSSGSLPVTAAPRDPSVKRASTASGQSGSIGVYTPLSVPQSPAISPQAGPGGMAPITPGGMEPGSSDPNAPGSSAPPSGTVPPAGTPPQLPTGDASPGTGEGRDPGRNFADLPNVIGDLGPSVFAASSAPTPSPTPLPVPPNSPHVPPPRESVSAIVRVFKIAENQSPRPTDRFFFSTNFFANVNQSVNQFDGSQIRSIKIYRYVFGFEKTFDEGRGSVGVSLPLYSQAANAIYGTPSSGPNGISTATKTSLGDLNVFAKYILKENKETGSLISAGLLLTPPTGPRYLAGANYFPSSRFTGAFVPVHDLQIQPFVGYIFQRGRFYIQGFSALNAPVAPQDVTQFFNDIQVGYILHQDRQSGRFLTAVIPTFEAHINNPLNHRGVGSPDPYGRFAYDPYGSPDTVTLTYGLNFEIRRNSLLSFAFAEPTTTFRPFNYEAILLFNYRFGRSRGQVNSPANVIGG
jgi:hypothetical protein